MFIKSIIAQETGLAALAAVSVFVAFSHFATVAEFNGWSDLHGVRRSARILSAADLAPEINVAEIPYQIRASK